MRPVDQTTFGVPGGNCFTACVASLLELPIDEVPYFMADDDWFPGFQQWLKRWGLWAVGFAWDEKWRPDGLCILSGVTVRHPTGLHSVVARGDAIVHDPHPSRAGLVTRTDVILLVPFDPSARGSADCEGCSSTFQRWALRDMKGGVLYCDDCVEALSAEAG